MALSNKKLRQVREAIASTSLEMLKEFAPESLEHAPESWCPETRQTFDLISDFETKACAAVNKVLAT